MFNSFRRRLSQMIAPSSSRLPIARPQSKVTSYQGAYDALTTNRASLRLDDQGLAQAASLSVWAARCMNTRASAVSRADWYVTPKGSDDRIEGDTNFDRALLYAFQTFRQNLMYNFEMSCVIWGETFLEPLTVGASSIPGGLRWVNNLSVSKVILHDELSCFEVEGGQGRIVKFEPDALFWYKYPSPLSDFDGLSPMVQALQAVNISRETIRFIQSFYRNDASPGGILTMREGVSLSEDEQERLIKQWEAQHRGSENSFFIALMPHGLRFESFDSRPPDNQTDLNEEQRREICGALNVPMAMVDAAGVSDPLGAGSTMGAQQIGWLENWFIPEVDNIAKFWNATIMPWLMPGHELHADTEQLLLAASQNAERSMMQNERLRTGGMSVNEWRKQQGLKELEGWDVHLIPSGVSVIDQTDIEGLLAIQQTPSLPAFPTTPALTMTTAQAGQSEAEGQGNILTVPAPEENALSAAGDVPLLPSGIRGVDYQGHIMMAVIKSIVEELSQWERFALKRVGKDSRRFEPTVIPEGFAADIQSELDRTEDKDTIAAIFRAARRTMVAEQSDEFTERVWATKNGTIDEAALALLIERMRELGVDDMIEQIESITGEDTGAQGREE